MRVFAFKGLLRVMLLLAVVAAVWLSGCSKMITGSDTGVPRGPMGTFVDSRDGMTYKTTTIGNQVWLGANLRYDVGKNWCYQDNAKMCNACGRLYDWETAKTACPAGWHLPTREEWNILVEAAGRKFAGRALKCENDTKTEEWHGWDRYGFGGCGCGYWASSNVFGEALKGGYWWTATEADNGMAYERIVRYNKDEVLESASVKETGYSVRCIQDAPGSAGASNAGVQVASGSVDDVQGEADPNKLTDSRDGKTYKIVVLGGKKWMAQNLNYRTGTSWCYGDDESKCQQYGRLYDWNTAKAACPKGWYLPSDGDWDSLAEEAAGEGTPRGTLSATTGWGENGNGTDDFGFSALPGGVRESEGGFKSVGEFGYWWTSRAWGGGSSAFFRSLGPGGGHFGGGGRSIGLPFDSGLSVRCVADE